MSISSKVISYLVAKGLTHGQIADLCATQQQTINRLSRGLPAHGPTERLLVYMCWLVEGRNPFGHILPPRKRHECVTREASE